MKRQNSSQAYRLLRSQTPIPGGLILQGAAMTPSPQLQKKMTQAVQTSMRIEGYAPQASPQAQAKAAELMKQQRVQVSVPSK
jgi:hypothetical protein